MNFHVGGEGLKPTSLEERVLRKGSVFLRQQTFVDRRNLPSKLVELERNHPNLRGQPWLGLLRSPSACGGVSAAPRFCSPASACSGVGGLDASCVCTVS